MNASLPTTISGLRLLAGPVILGLQWGGGSPTILLILFIIAALSDALDGFLARQGQCCTKIGAWLDHLADKILVTSTLFALCLVAFDRTLFILTWLTVQRELLALSARSYPRAGQSEPGESVAVSYLGKMKTLLQCLSLVLLWRGVIIDSSALWNIGLGVLSCAVALGWISLAHYFRVLWQSKN